MISVDQVMAAASTSAGQELPRIGGRATFRVTDEGGVPVFHPTSTRLPRAATNRARLERVVGKFNRTGSLKIPGLRRNRIPEPLLHPPSCQDRRRAEMKTTDPGYENRHGQVNEGPTGRDGNHHNQREYQMRCNHCGQQYGANGCDIHERRCPSCMGGAPGSGS